MSPGQAIASLAFTLGDGNFRYSKRYGSEADISFISSLCALASTALAVNKIVVQEQEFVDSTTNERFVVLGVDYQPGGQSGYGESNKQDPLSNATACLRDAALMQSLGVNTIRSYNVDPTLNHDECASIFNAVGIYMIIDVNSPLSGQSIDRSNPSSSYNSGYLSHIFTVVEAFKNYDNTLGFFAGNEIINDIPTAKDNPPYIRAVQRDLKNYIAQHAPRAIPVGYSAADVREVLQDTWAYLQCNNSDSGPDQSRSDFFGLNSYSWCGSGSSFQTAGYDVLVNMFNSTTVPVFFSEYGCNKPAPRVFDEVASLYGPQMTTLSGGLVYEWTQEEANYGLVNAYANGTAQLRQDFVALNGQYAKLNISLLTTSNNSATSLQPPKCSSALISNDGFSNNFNIPSPPDGADQLISAGVSNPPTGSLVSVTQTSVAVSVYNVDGSVITGLAIKPISTANHPGAASYSITNTVANAATATTASTSSKSGNAVKPVVTNGAVLGAAVAIAAFAL